MLDKPGGYGTLRELREAVQKRADAASDLYLLAATEFVVVPADAHFVGHENEAANERALETADENALEDDWWLRQQMMRTSNQALARASALDALLTLFEEYGLRETWDALGKLYPCAVGEHSLPADPAVQRAMTAARLASWTEEDRRFQASQRGTWPDPDFEAEYLSGDAPTGGDSATPSGDGAPIGQILRDRSRAITIGSELGRIKAVGGMAAITGAVGEGTEDLCRWGGLLIDKGHGTVREVLTRLKIFGSEGQPGVAGSGFEIRVDRLIEYALLWGTAPQSEHSEGF